MAQYPDLATLRSALTSDDSDRRAEAYGAVYEHTDLVPSDVLSDDDVTEELQAAGLIETPEHRPDSLDQHEEIVALLEDIKQNTEGS